MATHEQAPPSTVTALRRPPVRQSTMVRSDAGHTFDTFVRTIGGARDHFPAHQAWYLSFTVA
jgi:hypothetical protein